MHCCMLVKLAVLRWENTQLYLGLWRFGQLDGSCFTNM